MKTKPPTSFPNKKRDPGDEVAMLQSNRIKIKLNFGADCLYANIYLEVYLRIYTEIIFFRN